MHRYEYEKTLIHVGGESDRLTLMTMYQSMFVQHPWRLICLYCYLFFHCVLCCIAFFARHLICRTHGKISTSMRANKKEMTKSPLIQSVNLIYFFIIFFSLTMPRAVGLDLGSYATYSAVKCSNGIKTLLNDHGDRSYPYVKSYFNQSFL